MDYYLERLQNELKKILDFWLHNLISANKTGIYPELSISGKPNPSAELGSMYLSRVIYGSSAACRFFDDTKYKILADLAFKMLYEKFRNPAGGFYWSRDDNNKVLHDSSNANMAQAFVIYGLAEYAHLTKNPIVEGELRKQVLFLNRTIRDNKHGGFLDGFNMDWIQEKNFTKSLGTHIHMLEALTLYYGYSRESALLIQIAELIDIIYQRFIDKSTFECYHQLTPDWERLQNENWAGHNAEVSWIIYHAAKTINDLEKIKLCGDLAVAMTRKVIDQAFDKQYGGVFNAIKADGPLSSNKDWWPQAESAIACMNAYQISKDKYYLSYGLRLLEYIENTFSDSSGEWFTSVTREGKPVANAPKVHFWKSIYHNVRYCIELSHRLKTITNLSNTTH